MNRDINSPLLKFGQLDVFCGPMKSGKTREIIYKIDQLNFVDGAEVIFFKPKLDTRGDSIMSRFGDITIKCYYIDEKNPSTLFNHIKDKHNVIVFDEVHFFDKKLIDEIHGLLRKGYYVLAGGLDLDFRGEPFGCMPEVLSIANNVVKLQGICEYQGCCKLATRTQREINGEPAPYDSPTVLIGDQEEGYSCRCLDHHFIEK